MIAFGAGHPTHFMTAGAKECSPKRWLKNGVTFGANKHTIFQMDIRNQ